VPFVSLTTSARSAKEAFMKERTHGAARCALIGAGFVLMLASAARGDDKAPAPDKAQPVLPQNVETVPAGLATSVLGRKIRDASGVELGMVVDVLVDRGGMPLGAVIDFGGFLGVGSRKVAIDWQLLQFNPEDQKAPIVLALDRVEIQAAPEYKPGGDKVQMVGPPAAEGQSTPTPDKSTPGQDK
jgi:PRC-barrel domain protein